MDRGKWITPKETPSPVITVLHKIVAEVLRQNKNTNDYIKLYSASISSA